MNYMGALGERCPHANCVSFPHGYFGVAHRSLLFRLFSSWHRMCNLLLVMAALLGLQISDLHAQTNGLTLVPPYALPESGSFWRIQRDTAPLPFDPFPEVPLYSLGGNRYLIDDTGVDY